MRAWRGRRVIVAWQDRLSRENGAATAEVWEALDHAGARLVCAGEGLDTDTGDHEMLFMIKAAIAREQWKRHRANWERARRSCIERGVPAGRAPFGYRKSRGKGIAVDPRAAGKVLELPNSHTGTARIAEDRKKGVGAAEDNS